MRPQEVTVSSATFSNWIPVNAKQKNFGVSLGCNISSGAALTYQVRHTFENPWAAREVSISRATTTATVTDTAHGLSVGDQVVVSGSGSTVLDGTYAIAAITDANVYTYTVANSGPTASVPGTRLVSLKPFAHDTITAQTADAQGNYAFPVRAIQLNVTAYTSGSVTLAIGQGN